VAIRKGRGCDAAEKTYGAQADSDFTGSPIEETELCLSKGDL